MITINLEELAVRVSTLQELIPDKNIEETLNECVSTIVDICPIQVSENVYVNIFNELVSCLIDNTTIKEHFENILNVIIETSVDSIKINSAKWKSYKQQLNINIDVMCKELSVKIKEMKKSEVQENKTTKKSGRLPVNSIPETRQSKKKIGVLQRELLNKCSEKKISNSTGTYYYVKNVEENDLSITRGIYHAGMNENYPIKPLCNGYITIVKKSVTSSDSRYHHFSYYLEVLSINNTITHIELNSYELLNNRISERLVECDVKSYLLRGTKELLSDAIMQLAFEDTVIKQEERETLGYHITDEYGRVFLLLNGMETQKGFISLEDSPIVGMNYNDYSYYTGKNITLYNDDIMQKIFLQLNNAKEVQTILLSILGSIALVNFPIGDYAKGLDFVIELIGKEGLGKTPTINFMLGFFGTEFKHNTPTLLNSSLAGGDTDIARSRVMSYFSHMMLQDYDDKAGNESKSKSTKQSRQRNNTNNAIADKDTRRSSTKDGRTIIQKSTTGALIRTSNKDNAEISFLTNDMMVEKRTLSFLWNDNDMNDEVTSRYVSKHIEEWYAIGVAYRKWIMFQDDNQLQNIYDCCDIEATNIILSSCYDWSKDRGHKQHTIALITGLLLFKKFLVQDVILSQTFMIEWIDNNIDNIIQNRIARSQFLWRGLQQNSNDEMIQNILTGIRIRFTNLNMYVENQQAQTYTKKSTDIPKYGLRNLGYDTSKTRLEHGKVLVGYVVSKGEYIAFNKVELFHELQLYGKSCNPPINFQSKEYIERILIEKQLLVLDDNGKRKPYNIGKSKLYSLITIPLSTIYSDIEIEQDEQQGETQGETISEEKQEFINKMKAVKPINLLPKLQEKKQQELQNQNTVKSASFTVSKKRKQVPENEKHIGD